MSFTLTRTSSFSAGAMWSPTSSARYCAIIGRCRTAALGTHLERCDRCDYETVAYDSCRNRHCPKCQSSARDRWLMKQASSLLPVPYAHVVFTVPEQLAPLALRNQRLFYNLLFRAASETLLEIAADPRHLGARIGVLAVLHTWSQNLGHHPHLHCLVPAGGLALDRSRWVRSRRDFFLPVRVLSRMFRGKLLALRSARDLAMISVLVGCGLRRAELSALTVEDLQIRQGHWAIVDLVAKAIMSVLFQCRLGEGCCRSLEKFGKGDLGPNLPRR